MGDTLHGVRTAMEKQLGGALFSTIETSSGPESHSSSSEPNCGVVVGVGTPRGDKNSYTERSPRG